MDISRITATERERRPIGLRQLHPGDVEALEGLHVRPMRCWVAERGGDVVGTIAAAKLQPAIARLCWFRVSPRGGREALRKLLRAAVDHCRAMGCLKIVIELGQGPALDDDLARECGLHEARRRRTGPRQRIEFYIDLYRPGDAGTGRPGQTRDHVSPTTERK